MLLCALAIFDGRDGQWYLFTGRLYPLGPSFIYDQSTIHEIEIATGNDKYLVTPTDLVNLCEQGVVVWIGVSE